MVNLLVRYFPKYTKELFASLVLRPEVFSKRYRMNLRLVTSDMVALQTTRVSSENCRALMELRLPPKLRLESHL